VGKDQKDPTLIPLSSLFHFKTSPPKFTFPFENAPFSTWKTNFCYSSS